MVEGTQPRRAGITGHTQVDWCGCLWLWSLALVMLLLSCGLLTSGPEATERARPLRIGALTESWGPTPAIVALRDGLLELGYREHEQFVPHSIGFSGGEFQLLADILPK